VFMRPGATQGKSFFDKNKNKINLLQWRHNNNKYNNLRQQQQQHFIKKSITRLFQHLEPYHD